MKDLPEKATILLQDKLLAYYRSLAAANSLSTQLVIEQQNAGNCLQEFRELRGKLQEEYHVLIDDNLKVSAPVKRGKNAKSPKVPT